MKPLWRSFEKNFWDLFENTFKTNFWPWGMRMLEQYYEGNNGNLNFNVNKPLELESGGIVLFWNKTFCKLRKTQWNNYASSGGWQNNWINILDIQNNIFYVWINRSFDHEWVFTTNKAILNSKMRTEEKPRPQTWATIEFRILK